MERISIDEAFPSARKHVLIEPEEVATPETRDMEFSSFFSYFFDGADRLSRQVDLPSSTKSGTEPRSFTA